MKERLNLSLHFLLSVAFTLMAFNLQSQCVNSTVSTDQNQTTTYVCSTDGLADQLTFSHSNSGQANYAYVITDEQNNILGLPPGNSQDFEGVPPGTCRVWGLSYTGSITAAPGDNAAEVDLSDGCFQLSDNFITVVRLGEDDIFAGMVVTDGGDTEISLCVGDDESDFITFGNYEESDNLYTYIVTDEAGNILAVTMTGVDFNSAPAGVCLVYGLSFTGNLTATPGDNIHEAILSDACFDLTDNHVEVTRYSVDGGTVAMPSGATTHYTCPGDGNDDIIMFTHETQSEANYAYVITDEDLNILGLPPGDSQNFEGAGEGTCLVWGLSYTGSITAVAGDNAAEVDLSDGCFQLSDNFITVVRLGEDDIFAGMVVTDGGDTEISLCVGDDESDFITFGNYEESDNLYTYIVTDEAGNILAVTMTGVDFNGAPAGVCLVYGLSFTGNLTATPGDNVHQAILSDACFDLTDNHVEVTRYSVDGGTVAMPSGATTHYTCPGDGNDDIIMFTHETQSEANYAYVITDEDLNILGLPPGDSQNFEGAGEGTCLVWGLSYTGSITAVAGDNAAEVDLSDGCFQLSDNFITVVRLGEDDIFAGMVVTDGGDTEISLCVGDDESDFITFGNYEESDNLYTYIVTDEAGNILAVTMTGVDFNSAPAGVCLVYGLSFTGNLTATPGDNIHEAILSDACFDLTDNHVEVTRYSVDGGTVAMPSGATTHYTCPGDGNDDIIMFTHETQSEANYAYVITDEDLNILGLPPGDSQNFEGAGEGTCLVWGLSYTGSITAVAGDNAAEVDLSDGCFQLSDNFITVVRLGEDDIFAGMVVTDGGDTEISLSVGDDESDFITFGNYEESDNLYTYIVTDEAGNILAVTMTGVDFNSAPAGVCLVYGLSFTGNLTATPGDNIHEAILSDACFDLTDNHVEVTRYSVDGGTVAMPSGATTHYTCPGDGNDDIIMFTHETQSEANYAYVITDEDLNILGLPPGDSQNFEGAGEGTCLVWGLSYTGSITAVAGDNAAEVDLSDGCFQLSDNFITVVRLGEDDIFAGMVVTDGGDTEISLCVGDDESDFITFGNYEESDNLYTYIVTDEAGNILAVTMTGVDFNSAPAGVCLVYGLSFTGNLTATPGDNIHEAILSDACFDLTDNHVEVTRYSVDGGTVAMPSGATERTTCPGDGLDDIVLFTNTSESVVNYAYVITDEDYNILGLPPGDSQNFEGAGEGICLVWGLSYTGTITAVAGDNAAEVALSDGCFDLSDNYITITRTSADGGTVAMPSGATERTTCPGDGIDDIVQFTNVSESPANYAYVITDEDYNILGLPPGDSQNFEGAGEGVCLVWGLSYTGNITAVAGDNAAAVALSDGCFDLSDNYITVTRTSTDGGTVAMPSGATERSTCPGDGIDDIVLFTNTSESAANYTYVITDLDYNILGLPPGNSQNFEGAGEGTCLVWGLSYTGNITAVAGDNAAAVALSDGCFDLSDNYITVSRFIPDGGTVVTDFGETDITLCVGDGDSDYITFGNYEESENTYTYVVTDSEDNVLTYTMTGVDFEGAPAGSCHVWGLSYVGELNMETGSHIFDIEFTNQCYALSTNYVNVTRVSGDNCDDLNPLNIATGTLTNTLKNKTGQSNEATIQALPFESGISVETQLELAPNPVINLLNVRWTTKGNQTGFAILSVYSLDGSRLYQQELNVNKGINTHEVDVSDFDAGLYLLMIRQGDRLTTKKFVRQ